jgi:hypothetical protein
VTLSLVRYESRFNIEHIFTDGATRSQQSGVSVDGGAGSIRVRLRLLGERRAGLLDQALFVR